ncbi:hypothetical protein LINPERPRIM_LOCUS35630 [Linum perenne]
MFTARPTTSLITLQGEIMTSLQVLQLCCLTTRR